MSEMSRNDYGSGAIVDYSKETVKRIFLQNSPHSVEATGHDKLRSNLIPITSESLDSITTGTRVLYGNKEGVVTSVTMTVVEEEEEPPLISLKVSFKLPSNNSVVTEEYTKAELLSATNLFLVHP